jgi:myosin VIIa
MKVSIQKKIGELNLFFDISMHLYFFLITNENYISRVPTVSIGLMDMFGFENFKQNSFEQLIVNAADEELQNAFFRQSFTYDQQLYQREGLPYPQHAYRDNKKTTDLILQVIN